MRKSRKIGRYILTLLFLFLGLNLAFKRVLPKGEVSVPPIEERLLTNFPLIKAQFLDLKGETLFLTGGKKVLISKRYLFEKLAVLDTLLKRNESFDICDLRYDGIVVLRRNQN